MEQNPSDLTEPLCRFGVLTETVGPIFEIGKNLVAMGIGSSPPDATSDGASNVANEENPMCKELQFLVQLLKKRIGNEKNLLNFLWIKL